MLLVGLCGHVLAYEMSCLKLEVMPWMVAMTTVLINGTCFCDQYPCCQILLGGISLPSTEVFAIYLCLDMIYSICFLPRKGGHIVEPCQELCCRK